MLRKLWNDEAGAVISAEIVLVATILVIGMVVGLKSVRDSVVTELADVAQAIANLDQSYSYTAINGHGAGTAGSFFLDANDFCDTAADIDVGSTDSKCVNVCVAPVGEPASGTSSLP
jgi:Flp pilus assembly pilin Flp